MYNVKVTVGEYQAKRAEGLGQEDARTEAQSITRTLAALHVKAHIEVVHTETGTVINQYDVTR